MKTTDVISFVNEGRTIFVTYIIDDFYYLKKERLPKAEYKKIHAKLNVEHWNAAEK